MSKFKVTLRKNGRPVGEMCYPSEAVAVSQAAAMKAAAPGTTASVSTATKSNPERGARVVQSEVEQGPDGTWSWFAVVESGSGRKRAGPSMGHPTRAAAHRSMAEWIATKVNPRRRRNPGDWTVARRWWSGPRQDQPVAYAKAGHPNVVQSTRGTWYIDGRPVNTVYPTAEDAMVVAETLRGDEFGQFVQSPATKSNPRRRRNGKSGLRLASGSELEGSREIGSAHDAALAARIRGELAEMVARGMTPAQAVSAWMRTWDSMFLYDPPSASVRASQRAFVQSLAPKRNTHICRNPGCACRANPRRNPAEFAFDENFSRLMMRDGQGWQKAPHFKGHSPRAILQQIEALVADKSMSTGTAALLRQMMRNARFTEGAEAEFAAYVRKPRRRKNPRNGTWSAERMASLAQVAQFGRR